MVEWRISEGLTDYETAASEMGARAEAIAAGEAEELIWLLEHPPLYTAGSSAKREDLVDPDRFPVYETRRGGQYTYHGPGQRVAYAMLDLNKRGKDVRKFVADMEALAPVIVSGLSSRTTQTPTRPSRISPLTLKRSSAAMTQASISATNLRTSLPRSFRSSMA